MIKGCLQLVGHCSIWCLSVVIPWHKMDYASGYIIVLFTFWFIHLFTPWSISWLVPCNCVFVLQVGTFYRKVLTEEEKIRLCRNIAGHLKDAQGFIQKRAVRWYSTQLCVIHLWLCCHGNVIFCFIKTNTIYIVVSCVSSGP